MNWGSTSEFFAMGGYGLYVWGSYVVTLACIAGEAILLVRRRAHARRQLESAGEIDA